MSRPVRTTALVRADRPDQAGEAGLIGIAKTTASRSIWMLQTVEICHVLVLEAPMGVHEEL